MIAHMASPGQVAPSSPGLMQTPSFFNSATCGVLVSSAHQPPKPKSRLARNRPAPLNLMKTSAYDSLPMASPLATAPARVTSDPIPLKKPSLKRGKKRPGALTIPLQISTCNPGHLEKITPPPFLTSTTPPNTASRINQKLFLGSEIDARNRDLYLTTDVTQVLSIVSADSFALPDEAKNVRQMHIKLNDMSDQVIGDHFERAIEFVASNTTGSTLIHCRAGISRSSTLVMAYLMQVNHWTLNKAFSFVKSKRGCVAPNFGFLGQLQKFEYELAESRQLVDSD